MILHDSVDCRRPLERCRSLAICLSCVAPNAVNLTSPLYAEKTVKQAVFGSIRPIAFQVSWETADFSRKALFPAAQTCLKFTALRGARDYVHRRPVDYYLKVKERDR